MRGTLEFKPIVLGGIADPYLRTFELFAPGPLQWEVLAGPLPDDPVDYVVSPGDSATVLNFGVACGMKPPSRIWGNPGGRPQLGNQNFTLILSEGAPFRQALLALGFTVYAQWFQDLGVPFATSDAAAIRIGN